jgi:hypothetical protein
MEQRIKVAYEMDDIEDLTPDQKLDLLLKIGFDNRELLEKHSKILFGNGDKGLCDFTRSHGESISNLWIALKIMFVVTFMIISGFVGLAFK